MAKMIMSFRGREEYEIDSPDSPDGYDLPESVTKLGEWVGDSLTSMDMRREVLNKLDAAGWHSDEHTLPLYKKLADEVEKYKGSQFPDSSLDFYDWIKLPWIRAQLPADTPQIVSNSPKDAVAKAVKRLKNLLDTQRHLGRDTPEQHFASDVQGLSLEQIPAPTPEQAEKFQRHLEQLDKRMPRVGDSKVLKLEDKREEKSHRSSPGDTSNESDPTR